MCNQQFDLHWAVLSRNWHGSAAGSIQVELPDELSRPVGGRTLEDCPELYGDRIEQVVRWKNGSDLGKWTGKTVRLKVQMKDADLYSIRFR